MKAIIVRAYQIFRYPKPIEITNVCTECCMPTKEAGLLLTTDLKEIPVELIREYNDGAQALHLNNCEFKYFLPRYLELISAFQFTSAVDVSLSLKNVRMNEQGVYTPEEAAFLNDFATAFFQKCLKTAAFVNEAQLPEIINMLYVAGINVKPLWQLWLDDLSNFSVMHLYDLITDHFNHAGKMKTDGFIQAGLANIMEHWVISNRLTMLQAIEQHIMNDRLNKNQLQQLSYLYDNIRFL